MKTKEASRPFRVRVRRKVSANRLDPALVKDVGRIRIEREMSQRQAFEDALADWVAKYRYLLKDRA